MLYADSYFFFHHYNFVFQRKKKPSSYSFYTSQSTTMGLRDKFKRFQEEKKPTGSSSSSSSSAPNDNYQPPPFPPPPHLMKQSPSSSYSQYPDEKSQSSSEKKQISQSTSTESSAQISEFNPIFSIYVPDHQKRAEAMADVAPPPGPPPPGSSVGPPPGPPPGWNGSPADEALPSYSATIDIAPQSMPPQYQPSTSTQFISLYSHAPDEERDLGDIYTNSCPIYPPKFMFEQDRYDLDQGKNTLVVPPVITNDLPKKISFNYRFKGEIKPVPNSSAVYISTKKHTTDTTLVSRLPFYSPHIRHTSPEEIGGRNKFYFEVLITSIDKPEEASVALGFTCLPYPHFRLPGWHRGSIAVHSDDGHRYVNDSLAGKDFVRPFGKSGTLVGIGMNLERMSVFFTRNGRFEAEWSLIEDSNMRGIDPMRNFKDGGIQGLQGESDIYAAVGIYGAVGVQVNLNGPFSYKL